MHAVNPNICVTVPEVMRSSIAA